MKLENLLIQIGELIYTELGDVQTIEYDKNKLNVLTIVFNSGERFVVEMKKADA